MRRIRIRRAKLKGAKVQIGAELLCKSGKVSAAGGREGTRLRRTDYGEANRGDWLAGVWLARGKVGAWLCRALLG